MDGVFQVSKIRENYTLGADSGTETIDLPKSNYLQSFLLRVQNTNGSTSNNDLTISEDAITKLEVVADGVVIYTTDGLMTRHMEHFDSAVRPPYDDTQAASGVQYSYFPVKFGRHYSDKDLLVPAWMFSSLQLKITYAFTDSTTAGYTTSESNAKIDLIARYLIADEQENTPFLKKLEYFNKTLNTVQEEEVNLPVGAGNGSYRRLFIRAYESAIEDGVDIDKIALLVNDSQRIIDTRWNASQAEDSMRYNADGSKSVRVVLADNGTYSTICSNIRGVMAGAGVDKQFIGVDAVAGDQLTLSVWDLATPTAITAAGLAWINVDSSGVPFCTVMDLGTDDITDSLNVSRDAGISSLKIKLNVAAAGAKVQVIGEQLVRM